MKKNRFFFIWACLLFVFLNSCGNLLQPSVSHPVEKESEVQGFGIIFEWNPGNVTSQSKSLSVGTDEYFYYYKNLRSQNLPVYIPILNGKNKIKLPSDGIYIQSIVKRSIAGLVCIGQVGISDKEVHLISTEGMTGTLDLGVLELRDKLFIGSKKYSGTLLDERLAMLAAKNIYNVAITRFLNPDIDKDGLWDFEEGLIWEFRPGYDYQLPITAIDFSSGTVQESALLHTRVRYVLSFLFTPTPLPGYVDMPREQLAASGVNLTIKNENLTPQTKVINPLSVIDYGDGTQLHYADLDQLSPIVPTGNFAFAFPNTAYPKLTIDNVRLMPSAEATNTLYFPIPQILVNEKNQPTRIEWKWVCKEGDHYRSTQAEEIKKFIAFTYFDMYGSIPYNLTPENYGKNYWDNDFIELSPTQYPGALLSSGIPLRIVVRDFADNSFIIHIPGKYFEYDPRYVSADFINVPGLLGKWSATTIIQDAPEWICMNPDFSFQVRYPGDPSLMSGSYSLEVKADPNDPGVIGKGLFFFGGETFHMLYRFPTPNTFSIMTDSLPLDIGMWNDNLAFNYSADGI